MFSSELWNKPVSGGASFYDHQIEQSARFDLASSSYLSLASPISTDQTILAGGSGTGSTDNYVELRLRTNSDNTIRSASTEANVFTTTAMYRDPSGWNHGCWNNNNGTSTFYVNGTQVGSGSFDGGSGGAINSKNMTIGRQTYQSGQFFNGYLAEMIMISHSSSAAVLTPTSFTETKNGVFIPKDVSTLSNKDFYLKFENASSLGNDSSGNNRDWTANAMPADHQVLDSPTFGS